jgi:predicted transglutaminase-like cysteine proteinase
VKTWHVGKPYVIALLVAFASIAIGAGFEAALTDKQLAAIEAKYGQPARKRVTDWLALIANNKKKPDQEKLELVNDFFNQILFVSDVDHWGVADYWETPIEMLGTGGGDCEDFSISKYFTLVALGVPEDKLKITYVKARNAGPQNAAHMVLTYYPTPEAMPVVLDNLVQEIKSADQRPDLTPVYSFNANGLWLAKERGSGKAVAGGNKINLWKEMMARMSKDI